MLYEQRSRHGQAVGTRGGRESGDGGIWAGILEGNECEAVAAVVCSSSMCEVEWVVVVIAAVSQDWS